MKATALEVEELDGEENDGDAMSFSQARSEKQAEEAEVREETEVKKDKENLLEDSEEEEKPKPE